MEIKFPVRHYTFLHDFFLTFKRHFRTGDEKQDFVSTFHALRNKHVPRDGYTTEFLGVCYGQNSLQIDEKLVSHFPIRVYNSLEALAKTVMTPANCRSSKVPVPKTDNSNFFAPEPVFVYTDIIKPNLVGHS
jgi:hypothetical protein